MRDVLERPDGPDVQGQAAAQRVDQQRGGVRGIGLPLAVAQRAGAIQVGVARASLSVDLPHHQKGTHMSRLVEALDDRRTEPVSGAVLEAARADVRRWGNSAHDRRHAGPRRPRRWQRPPTPSAYGACRRRAPLVHLNPAL